ncbi:energy transducer TonB [Rhizobiaceae bacterium BDR2-2]|uniref:Protein TonB n=1 Tax=Ectorhizobium quercum TaxID=2965071 RepID=A0AAE3N1F8_9HYPH|nr:energy transducer TonB [Ectorhizobium quercum]MCX8998391.1 energy transducer TonB [Ectorhizobium quercum]
MGDRRAGHGGTALPRLSAVAASLALHGIGWAAAVLATTAPPVAEPQPMAIMVEFVPEPAIRDEIRQEVQAGEPDAPAKTDAAPDESEAKEPEEIQPEEAVVAEEMMPAPDSIPVPLRRPKPEERKTAELKPDKREPAEARGLADDPPPDAETGETLKAPGAAELAMAAQTVRGSQRTAQAEERWQARLLSHLERRKRYPSRALSRRQEGVVHVRFVVEPDGAVTFPELAQSSGVAELDEEVLSLVRRAAPLPRPPPGVNRFVTVPVSFDIKR